MKSSESSNLQTEIGPLTSVEGMDAEGVQEQQMQPLPFTRAACIEVLHDLNNAFAGVLLNAQVLDCKLPSYSRSKRYIHEIERGALRGNVLVKRLLGHLAGGCDRSTLAGPELGSVRIPPVAGSMAVVANQGPTVAAEGVMAVIPSSATPAAPVFGSE